MPATISTAKLLTALQAADSLATTLIHKLPTVIQPAFAATIQYYQTKALIGVITPLLIALMLLPIYNYYLAILLTRLADAKERQDSGDVRARANNLTIYKSVSALPFIILSIFFTCGICDALPFFLAPQVATALALLNK